MSTNVHQITARQFQTITLAAAATSATIPVPASVIGVIADITGTIDIDLQVSNDGTVWNVHPDYVSTPITGDTARVNDMPFLYMRFVDTAGDTGQSATISVSW